MAIENSRSLQGFQKFVEFMNLFEFMFAKLKLNLNFFSFLRFLDVLDFLNESIEEHLLGFYS